MAQFSDMTLADYMGQIKARLDIERDLDNQLYTDDDMKLYLATAQIEFVRKMGGSFYRKTLVVDADNGMIDMPADFLGGMVPLFSASPTQIPVRLAWNSETELDERGGSWRSAPATLQPSMLISRWDTTGQKLYLWPQLTTAVTDALTLSYLMRPPIMEADDDISAVMQPFPELQPQLLVAGALKTIYLNENGESDDQAQKWDAIFERCISDARSAWNTQFTGAAYYGGR